MKRGYIFKFENQRCYSPEGNAGEMTDAEIQAHNEALDAETILYLKNNGAGVLYLTTDASGSYNVSTWQGKLKIPAWRVKHSWHNMAGKDGRTDVWFNFEGSSWHGVNIGDNQMLRVKRTKAA